MKKITFLAAILISTALFAQYETTSFEEPEAVGGKYTDTGDPVVAHDLIDNAGEPFVNFTSTGGELGFSASYAPYDEPGVGLTDGDFVGVTTFTPTGDNPYPDGVQGYQISDVDGNYILEFDEIISHSTGPSFSLNYFIADEGYEGDGTENSSGSDRIRIYVKDLTNDTEFDILNSTGTNINDLGLQGTWQTGSVAVPPFDGTPFTFQLVIEVRCNASAEAFFFDNVIFDGLLGLGDNNQNLFSVYPNPANNYVNISSQEAGEKNVAIYNVIGKLVINTITSERVDISTLTSGVYIVKISQNGVSSTKKLVVR